jgi:hypothetical protein
MLRVEVVHEVPEAAKAAQDRDRQHSAGAAAGDGSDQSRAPPWNGRFRKLVRTGL